MGPLALALSLSLVADPIVIPNDWLDEADRPCQEQERQIDEIVRQCVQGIETWRAEARRHEADGKACWRAFGRCETLTPTAAYELRLGAPEDDVSAGADAWVWVAVAVGVVAAFGGGVALGAWAAGR